MSLQQRSLRKTYFHYLFAGLGSAVVVSIYSLVDAIMIGQYEGSDGSAALSVVMPIWTIILSLGLLFGVGGGVLMSKARGEDVYKRQPRSASSIGRSPRNSSPCSKRG